jgi:hypothetical protein
MKCDWEPAKNQNHFFYGFNFMQRMWRVRQHEGGFLPSLWRVATTPYATPIARSTAASPPDAGRNHLFRQRRCCHKPADNYWRSDFCVKKHNVSQNAFYTATTHKTDPASHCWIHDFARRFHADKCKRPRASGCLCYCGRNNCWCNSVDAQSKNQVSH